MVEAVAGWSRPWQDGRGRGGGVVLDVLASHEGK